MGMISEFVQFADERENMLLHVLRLEAKDIIGGAPVRIEGREGCRLCRRRYSCGPICRRLLEVRPLQRVN